MVTIKNYHQRTSADGETFYVLELLGDVEIVQSKETSKSYATRRKVSMPTTFDKASCEELIGGSLPGSIVKVKCDPYSYVIEETGEEITLHHTYNYVGSEEELEQIPEKVQADINAFSVNGLVDA